MMCYRLENFSMPSCCASEVLHQFSLSESALETCDVSYSAYLLPHHHPLSLQLQFCPLQLGYNFNYVMCHTLNSLRTIIRHTVTIILLQAIISPQIHHHTVTRYHIVTSNNHTVTRHHIITVIVT